MSGARGLHQLGPHPPRNPPLAGDKNGPSDEEIIEILGKVAAHAKEDDPDLAKGIRMFKALAELGTEFLPDEATAAIGLIVIGYRAGEAQTSAS